MPETGPTSERLESLRTRWESDKGSRVFLQLADEYRRLGRAEDAVAVLEEGLTENPRYPAAQVALGRCRLELGRADAAAETLERVVENDPTQMVAYRLLVDAYVAQGKPEEARQSLRVYSLLNDADPDIAELRRRIGQLEREDRTGGTAGSLPAEPETPEDRLPPLPSEEELEQFPELEEAVAAPDPGVDPFPDLEPAPAPREGAAPEDDVFGMAVEEPEPAAGRGRGDPFDLDLPAPPPAADLSSLLDPETTSGAEPAVEEMEAPAGEDLAFPEESEAPAEPPPTPSPAPLPTEGEDEGRPTVTLGLLYLRQGHTREAEEIFRAVLEKDPENTEALRHLEAIGEQLRAELAEPRRLTASDLLEGWEGEGPEAGTTQRKRHVLERYRDLLRAGVERDVH